MKKHVVYVLAGFLFSLVAGGAVAGNEQWKYLGANEKGEQFFYDETSVMRLSGDVLQVRTRELTGGAPQRRLEELNCRFKIVRDLQVVAETPNKAPVVRSTPSPWRARENDRVTRELFKALCR